jgi:hypothetical protein
LGIAEPAFRAFKDAKSETQLREKQYFGLWLPQEHSLVIAKDDLLISYGSDAARDRLFAHLRYWLELGMPTAASLTLRIYPSDAVVSCGKNDWLVKRRESQFMWSLPSVVH